MVNYNQKKNQKNRTKITTGPFLVPLEVDSELQCGRDNDRLIITLQNSTHKELESFVKLGICLQPTFDEYEKKSIRAFENIPEKEINLGTYILEPYTCTIIERDIPGGIGDGKDEKGAIYRVTAEGDFLLSQKTNEPICGLLEISVVIGSVFNPLAIGLEQADAATFFRFKDFVFCEC
ncbi:hypothetical protein AT269_09415 [Bacillus cereus]|nr:hypothetical protein AT269_09415 [Bacillus cereus]